MSLYAIDYGPSPRSQSIYTFACDAIGCNARIPVTQPAFPEKKKVVPTKPWATVRVNGHEQHYCPKHPPVIIQ